MSNKFKAAVVKFRAFPRYVRWSTYTLSAYLFYAALLGLLVPYIAKQQIPEQLSALIERPVMLTDITINPFTLQLDVHQFAILEDTKPFVQFEHASVQVNFWQSIFNAAISVEYISLNKPYINLERLNNTNDLLFNFSDIIDAVARNTVTTEEPELKTDEVIDRKAPLFPVLIKHTALTQGDIRLLDGVTGTQLAYPNINITLGEFSTQSLLTDAEKKNDYRLHITDVDSGTVELTGQVQLKPLEVVGDIDVQHIQLPRLWGFIEKDIIAKLTSGEVSFSSNYHIVQTIGETETDDSMSISTAKGMFSLNGLNFNAKDKSIVSLPNLSVNNIATNVENQTVNIASITSQGLNVSAKVDDKGADLVTLFTPTFISQESEAPKEKKEVTPTKPEPESNSPAWLVTLDGVEIKDYQLNVEEKVVTKKANQWQISPINLTTSQIVSDLSKPIDFDFFTSINGKGDISVKGQADAKQQAVLANIDVKSLKLAQFQPYLATAVNTTLTKGEVNTQAKLNANAEGSVEVSGGLQVNHLSIRDNKLRKPFVKWRSLAVNKFNFDLQKSKLNIDTLSLNQPYARVVINEDRSTNIGDLIVPQPKSKKTKTSSKKKNEKPFDLRVRKIAFNNGSAFFADNSLTPNFSSGIEQLKGNIGHVSSIPGTKATVDISGNIEKYAPVKVKGEINPLLKEPYLDLDVIFKSVELTTVNPYSGTYAGHYIDKGQLTLALNYQLKKNQLKGENHVIIDQLQLGKASDSDVATSLPLELAIALLQDNNGVIDLGVEVSGDVNDPEFSLGAVIWSTISNIITKAVTAPFSFIAGLAGSDEELNIIAFDFGANTLTAEEQEKLKTLGSALETRPKLKLTVDGAVNAPEDSKALALVQFNQLLADSAHITVAELPVNLSASTMPISGQLSDSLQELYQTEFGEKASTVEDKIENEQDEKGVELTDEELAKRWHIALYNLVLNKQDVKKGDLGQLAQQRAQAVKAYLVDVVKVDASRVFLLDSRFDIEQDTSSVLLSLEAK
ncbi:DUF748 domain-containing protein [Aliivibrio sifiae]|uniref:ATPase n=1 Tax=Aliivibrio sifiae TaxID=566293 RepID=A0A2S7X2D0_9GAMM|nr:DUF748 domain-containing protein [Aliivibrio sifiae]PQJ84275.1 ATPase [Aliivibrio sifiae]